MKIIKFMSTDLPSNLFYISSEYFVLYEPGREKTCIPSFRPGLTKPGCTTTENGKRLKIADLGEV